MNWFVPAMCRLFLSSAAPEGTELTEFCRPVPDEKREWSAEPGFNLVPTLPLRGNIYWFPGQLISDRERQTIGSAASDAPDCAGTEIISSCWWPVSAAVKIRLYNLKGVAVQRALTRLRSNRQTSTEC